MSKITDYKIAELIMFLSQLTMEEKQYTDSSKYIDFESGDGSEDTYIIIDPWGKGEGNYFKIEFESNTVEDEPRDDYNEGHDLIDCKDIELITKVSYWNWDDDKTLYTFDDSHNETVLSLIPCRYEF